MKGRTMMNSTLGERIAALRRERGFKQDELAERLGVSPQAVSKWENDVSCPDIMILPELAECLGVTVDELLSGKKSEPEVRMIAEGERKDIKDMMLRILVTSYKGDEVRVNLPMPLVSAAIETGISVNGLTGVNIDNADIDWSKLIKLIESGAVGKLVEVESHKGDTVEIIVE